MKSKFKGKPDPVFRMKIVESSDVGADGKPPVRFDIQNIDALAQVPIEAVASIAAQLIPPWESPVERVRQAYTLLDAAAAGRHGLVHHRNLERGFADFVWRRDVFRELQGMLSLSKGDPLVTTNSKGERVADFESVLKSFFGVGQSASKIERMERLLWFIQETSMNPETQMKGIPWEKAEACLADWQANGIPDISYCCLKGNFARWWSFNVARTNRENASVPKGKQGRVKRKDDKRRGARTPRLVDELKKSKKAP
jgi:hypothetical protein